MEEMEGINKLTEKVIGCAIEVHRVLGPGLFKSMKRRYVLNCQTLD